MITLQEFCKNLGEKLDVSDFEDYCPNGLQVEGKTIIKKGAFAVSATLETIESAVDWGADILVVHHGLFWQNDSYVVQGPKKEKLAYLLSNSLSLAAYHLPLDAHRSIGNNWKAAEEMKWKKLRPFSIGVQGEIDEISPQAFAGQLEHYYSHEAMYAPGKSKTIKRVALVSGGAYKLLPEAKKAGVDAFVTGNFDEPAWYLAKEHGVHFYSLGHSATERVGPRALAEWVRDSIGIQTTFLDIENPF